MTDNYRRHEHENNGTTAWANPWRDEGHGRWSCLIQTGDYSQDDFRFLASAEDATQIEWMETRAILCPSMLRVLAAVAIEAAEIASGGAVPS